MKRTLLKLRRKKVTFQSNGLQLKGTIWKPNKPNNRCLFIVTSSQEATEAQ
ncbi:MAG: hypothetical protein IPO92_20560 [Saprospiraceae bacterium]|nr:hypothetical protein [Saprospiraceae bacterium]